MIGGNFWEPEDANCSSCPWIQKEVRTVEILDMTSETWTEEAPIDSRWILYDVYGPSPSPIRTSSSYGFIHMDDKPTIIGFFNDTNINVVEQFDVVKGSWTLKDYDMTDPPCDSQYPCLYNAVNIPSHIFAPCK